MSLSKVVDLLIFRIYLKFFKEKNSLLVFNFHGMLLDEKEKNLNLLDPYLCTTLEDFRSFVEYYSNHDYLFIAPDDIVNGLDYNRKYILITFDDGYFNNKRVLPILREFKAPCVFFISTDNVKYNKCFWWDILYREGLTCGMRIKDIHHKHKQLKLKTIEEIEKHLINLFGDEIFRPKGDVDRPFTSLELKDFSKEKFVFLGNHTKYHNILTNYSPKDVRFHILSAQNALYDIMGANPIAIAYPNGDYSDEIIRISKEIGLQLGFTSEFKKNSFPLDWQGNDYMHLGRFNFCGCTTRKELIERCIVFRSDIAFSSWTARNLSKCETKS